MVQWGTENYPLNHLTKIKGAKTAGSEKLNNKIDEGHSENKELFGITGNAAILPLPHRPSRSPAPVQRKQLSLNTCAQAGGKHAMRSGPDGHPRLTRDL